MTMRRWRGQMRRFRSRRLRREVWVWELWMGLDLSVLMGLVWEWITTCIKCAVLMDNRVLLMRVWKMIDREQSDDYKASGKQTKEGRYILTIDVVVGGKRPSSSKVRDVRQCL